MVKDGRALGVRVCKASSMEGLKSTDGLPETTELRAPIIINATGMHTMYNKLLPQDLPLVKEFKNKNKCIPSYGHNYLFVAIKGMIDFIDQYQCSMRGFY